MTQPNHEDLHPSEDGPPPAEDLLPDPVAKGHAKVPQGHHDDALVHAAERAEVEAGVRDYRPDDVPDAEPVDDLPDLDDD